MKREREREAEVCKKVKFQLLKRDLEEWGKWRVRQAKVWENNNTESERMLLLRATLHRKWYAPGDNIKAEVEFQCLANEPNSALKSRFRDVGNSFGAPVIDNSSVSITASITGRVVCTCVVDSRLLQYALAWDKGNVAQHCPELVDESTSSDCRVYKLCCSDDFALAQDIPLRLGETKAVSVTFAVPDSLPPSYKGRCLRFCHTLLLKVSYHGEGEPTSSSNVRIPISVFSPQSVLSPLLLPLCFPMDNFNFRVRICVPDPPQPFRVDEHELNDVVGSGLSCRRPNFIASHLAKQRTPLEFPLSFAGDVVLTVVVSSTTVMIGSSLRAAFLPRDGCISRVVMVQGVLEMLECTFPEHLQRGVTCHELPGEESRLVVTQTSVVEEFEWNLIGRSSVPISIPFSNINYCASMQTDAVTTCWQLRLRFLWCSASRLKEFSSGFRSQLPVEEEQPELVVPLTVVPPPNPGHIPRKGITLEVIF